MYRIGVSSHLTWLFLSYVGRPGSEHSRSMTRRGARPLALTFRSPGMRYGDMAWVKDTNWEQHLSPAEARARPKVSVFETIRNSRSCSVWYFSAGGCACLHAAHRHRPCRERVRQVRTFYATAHRMEFAVASRYIL
jgi:hypothetical protein